MGHDDVSLVGYGEGSINEQKCKETFCPKAIQPTMFFTNERVQNIINFTSWSSSHLLPHTWPICLLVCFDLEDIKNNKYKLPIQLQN
jgi:hypothetical protein